MKNSIFYIVSIAITIQLISISAFGQDSQELKLKSGNYELVKNLDLLKKVNLESVKYRGYYYVYVHFTQIPTVNQKQELQVAGVELFDFVPDNSFMARVKTNVNLQNLSNYNIDGVYLTLPEFKMSYSLATQNYPEHALNSGKIKLVVQNYAHASNQIMDDYYRGLDASVLSHYTYSSLTTIEVPVEKIKNIASHPLVKYLEPIAPKAVHEDILGQSNHRSNYISNTSINAVPFNGSGVWIAIGDDGELGPHIDYTGRMDQTSVGPSGGTHGDHVGGIMMGAGNLDPMARGMAWGADIKVYDVWDAVYSTPVSYFNPGVIVTSTSYGNGCNAGYTAFAQTADQQVRQMPNLMHVFSAGNSGTSNCGYGAGAGWGNITGGIKAGKNVMAVGNVLYNDNLAGSSSRGPASDGRIKPDICANGTQVFSCQPNNTYANFSGTSMAAPGVSGTYGQLVHAYRVLNGGVTPPSALVKGTLLNTADDLGNVGPDFKFGWGRMNARKVVEVFENNTYMVDSITQGVAKTHTINVPSGVKQMKVMVYWNDYEGSTVSTLALVNNIDMNIANPSGSVFLPYILDPTPNATNLNTPATNGVDNLNNMEQVVFDNPTSGNYVVNITGTSIPQGPQTYYVIYEFITDDIIVTYPTGGEGFEPGTSEAIRWDAVIGTNTFMLEYSVNNGASWTAITNTVNATIRFYDWTVPSSVTGKALVRITRNGISGQSMMPFTIIGVPSNIQVSSACPDSFSLTWNAVPGATFYEVSMLGSKYMDSVTTVNTTTATITGVLASNSYWVSVKAKTIDAVGKRAIAVQKQPGVWNCALANDIDVSGQLPSGNALFNCVDYSSVNITVKLKNMGISAVSNIDLVYQFNGGAIVSGQYTGTILPGDSVNYSFSQTVSFNTVGLYQVDVWKTTPDDNTFNDTIINPFQVYAGTSFPLPYNQDFETFTNCITASNCGATVCNLTQGWLNIENGVWDDIDFRVYNGGTPSSGTGPNTDHKPGSSNGKYLYLEASGGCTQSSGELISPCIELGSAVEPHATMWYHMLGTALGELHFDVFANGKWYNDYLPILSGSQGSAWNMVDFNLAQFSGSKVNIRFRGITGSDWSSDIAVDDFSVFDAALSAVIIADSLPCFSAGPVTVSSGSIGDINSYSWDFGVGATPASASTVGPHSIIYATPGLKTVQLIVSNGLNSDTTLFDIQVALTPVVSFSSNYNPTTDSVEFTNNSTDIGSVLWEFGDGNTSTGINPIHKYQSPGTYTVVLKVTNGCGTSTESQLVGVLVGSQNIYSSSTEMTVFPNPGNGNFTVQLGNLEGSSGELEVYNTNGKLVLAKQLNIVSQKMNVELDLQSLAKGIYILRFKSDEALNKVRIIIQ